MIDGFAISDPDAKPKQCTACLQGKHRLTPFPKESTTTLGEIGDIVVSDVWGPAPTRGIHGEFYFTSFTD
ncbi:hypothetical protein BKA62DRAFT_625802, partial [Auriculariales sp. MPI-PUGE-AT-0066]